MAQSFTSAEESMPDFFTTPPSARLLRAKDTAPVPERFQGRAGVLLVKNARGEIKARYAFTSLEGPSAGFVPDWTLLKADVLWPERDEANLPVLTLFNGRKVPFTLSDFFSELFADYPDKPWDQGGSTIARRKGLWREAIVKSLESPAVKLLNAFNQSTDTQALELVEWWVGESPAHEMRVSGTCYPPLSAGKLLLAKLTEGLELEARQPLTAPHAPPPLPIIFEDEAMVVVNKPSRLASVPGIRETVSAKSILEETRGTLHVVHRLDMDTSGLLVFAKTLEAERALHQAFRDGLAMKVYTARLAGELPSPAPTRVELPLAINAMDRPRQCVLPIAEGGKPSATDVEVLRVDTMPDGARKSVVALYPETGRTHQLRVHCAHPAGLGIAIDGDPFYGSDGLLAEDPAHSRLCLHATELTIPHPTTGMPITFSAAPDFPLF